MSEVGRRHGFLSWSWCGWLSAVDMPALPNIKATTQENLTQALITPKDYKLLLRSIVATFTIGEPVLGNIDLVPTFANFPLLDSNSTICGLIQLPLVRNDLVGTHKKFVVLKEANLPFFTPGKLLLIARPWNAYNISHKYPIPSNFDGTEADVKARAWRYPLFIVLMLDKVKGGGLERAGIGHIYRNALFWSLHHSIEDEIILG